MQQLHQDKEFIHIDVIVLPTPPPPPEPIEPSISPKLLAIMKKYKRNWRLDQLSKPRTVTKKFVRKEIELLKPTERPELVLSDETRFYADHMSRPPLRHLYVNKRSFEKTSRNYRRKINKNINKAWGSIYNFYKKRARDRRLRQLRKQAKEREKKFTPNLKRYDELAQPKKLFVPQPAEIKPSKIFTNYGRLDELASPKPFTAQTPKTLEVNPAALTYEATENIIKLAKVPARFLNQPIGLEPGQVRKSALRYQITPRIEAMAVPKQRSESKEDEDFDPFAISKNALKYKPTTRILELAKPLERD